MSPTVSTPEPRPPHPVDGVRLGVAGCADFPHLSLDRRLHAQGPVDPHGSHHHLLPRLRAGAARARRAAAPDAVESARRARRRGLFDPRARRPWGRSARRGHDRGQRARRDAPPPAPRRARGDDAAQKGDGRDRCRGFHLRRRARAEVRQPGRRATPEPAIRTAAREASNRSRPRRLPER